MDVTFASELAEWHDFFATVAGVSGTLVGLLFVALGLNPAIMADESPAGLRVLSGLTFHSFLVLLMIGIVGLVPDDDGQTLMVTMVVVGVQGLIRVGLDLRQVRTDPDPDWSGRQALGRVVSPTLAYLTCLWLAYSIWRQDAGALGWFVAVVLMLTIGAASSCWDLLKTIGERHQPEGA